MNLKHTLILKIFPVEAAAWTTGLLCLFFLDPGDAHVTLCPFSMLNFNFCPGCGLGRSISYLFHGELSQSFQTHPIGVFAAIILGHRIIMLTKQFFIRLRAEQKN